MEAQGKEHREKWNIGRVLTVMQTLTQGKVATAGKVRKKTLRKRYQKITLEGEIKIGLAAEV